VNNVYLEPDEVRPLRDGDVVAVGPLVDYVWKFILVSI
jgi:hypothetical protein